MRLFIGSVVLGLSSAMATEVGAQYTQVYVQGAPMASRYVYVYPYQWTYAPGYQVAVPQYTRPPNPTGFANRPYYGAYGYGNYSNGSTDGFPPFRGRRSR